MSAESSEQRDHSTCEKMLFSALNENLTIRKLIAEIEDAGCPIPQNFFRCRPSTDQNVSGGFLMPMSETIDYVPGIVVFENRILGKESFENTVAHELVHAYDQCRAKINLKNCIHHACTEIRASNLSGECNWWQEVQRGNLAVVEGRAKCVKRRAGLSLAGNPFCKDQSTQAIEAAFSICYNDISPLTEDDLWKS